MGAFQSSDEIPAVIVYERPGGATTADIAAVAEQVKQFDDVDDVRPRRRSGRSRPRTGRRCRCIVPDRPRQRRLGGAGHGGRRRSATITDDAPDGLSVHITGPGGFAADSSEAFEGIDGKLLYSAIGGGRGDPAAHLPQPAAVDAAGVLRGRGADRRPGGRSTSWPRRPT